MDDNIRWESIESIDRHHLWHPYAKLGGEPAPLVVREAYGTRLVLADGRELIDAMSSWWAAIHGYRHPVLDDAVRQQLNSMSHVMFGGLTHEPAAKLASLLVKLTGMDTVFFCDSGSVAIEVAVKTVLQYQKALGRSKKRQILTPRGGYYGDTFTPMSLCDPEGGMHSEWTGSLTPQVFVPRPPVIYEASWEQQVRRIAEEHAEVLAGIIVEPIVQGAGGMRMYDPRCLAVLGDVAQQHDLLLVYDEIATGFGRTGTLFAAEQCPQVSPDIQCVGKALTGGYMSLAAVLGRRKIADTINDGGVGVLLHGPTFMANPLACATSVAAINLLIGNTWGEEGWQGSVKHIEHGLREGLSPLRQLPNVVDVRVMGAIGVVELSTPVDLARATRNAVESGVWLRPFGKLVYTMPPFISSESDIKEICSALHTVVLRENESIQ